MNSNINSRLLVLFAILLISIPGLAVIPKWSFWGLDLQELYAFHNHCSDARNPYLLTGSICGDALGRDLAAPPLLYWSFYWLRWVSFQSARLIFLSAYAVMLIGCFAYWARGISKEGKHLGLLFLLAIQLPVIFALERLNIDISIVALWSLAHFFFKKQKYFIVGLIFGLLSALKIYPVIPTSVILVGVAQPWLEKRSWKLILSCISGMLVAVLLAFSLLPEATMTYFSVVLPKYSSRYEFLPGVSHSLMALLWKDRGSALIFEILLYLAWTYRSWDSLYSDPDFVFAGAIAVSTYFASVSYDYNLVTVYPLLILLIKRTVQQPGSLVAWALTAFGFFAILGNRYFLINAHYTAIVFQVLIQYFWLIAVSRYQSNERIACSEMPSCPKRYF